MDLARDFVRVHRDEIIRASVVGSVFRQSHQCHDVDILIIPRLEVTIRSEPPINIFMTTEEEWQTALMQYAPSAGSTIGARAAAKSHGYKLSQHGLYDRDTNELITRDAHTIYEMIGTTKSQWVEKSLRGEGNLI